MSKAHESIFTIHQITSEKKDEELQKWWTPPHSFVEFSDDGESLLMYDKMFDMPPGSYKVSTVMTKEVFQKCYEKWILGKEENE